MQKGSNQMNIVPKLKGKDKYETWENYAVLFIFIGGLILSAGIGLTAFSTRGVPAILSMLGAVIAFMATVALIFIWLINEFRSG